MRQIFSLLVGALIAGGIAAVALLTANTNGSQQGVGGGDQRVPVIVAEVSLDEFIESIEAIGTTQANESVTITARVTETVEEVLFDDGAQVATGDVLVRLNSDEERAQLAEARVNVAEQRREVERIRGLVQQNLVPELEIDEQQSLLDGARARVEAAKARINDRIVRAPFAGVLGIRRVSPGGLVEPGDLITTLDDISVIKLDFDVPETALGMLTEGLPVEAYSRAYGDQPFRGEVSTVDSRVDPVTRSVTVRAVIPNPELRLRPGMLMRVELIRERREALVIPEESVVPVEDNHYVFVVGEDETVSQRAIELGGRRPGAVEVRSGLSVGERIVTDGVNRIREGTPVTVIERLEGAAAVGRTSNRGGGSVENAS